MVADLGAPGSIDVLGPAPYLVAMDVDGTVLPWDAPVSATLLSSLTQLRAAGSHPVLATGRGLLGTLEAAHVLGLQHGWAVCSNGAMTLRLDPHLPGGYAIEDAITFDPRPVLTALRERVPGAFFAVEDGAGTHRVNAPFPEGTMFGEPPVVPFEELCDIPATRVCVYEPNGCREDFQALSTLSHLQQVTYAVGWTAWLDLTPPGVSKASGLELVRQTLAIEAASTVAVGDGDNDTEMLRWARLGVAMAGGTPAALAAADAVTADIADDGVAHLIAALLHRPASTPTVPPQ